MFVGNIFYGEGEQDSSLKFQKSDFVWDSLFGLISLVESEIGDNGESQNNKGCTSSSQV